MNKKTSPAKEQSQSKSQSNSTSDQRNRLEAEIRQHPVTTIYAREELDILAPAARIWELRHNNGLNIHTHWKSEETACGKTHSVAEYALFSGKWEGKVA